MSCSKWFPLIFETFIDSTRIVIRSLLFESFISFTDHTTFRYLCDLRATKRVLFNSNSFWLMIALCFLCSTRYCKGSSKVKSISFLSYLFFPNRMIPTESSHFGLNPYSTCSWKSILFHYSRELCGVWIVPDNYIKNWNILLWRHQDFQPFDNELDIKKKKLQ